MNRAIQRYGGSCTGKARKGRDRHGKERIKREARGWEVVLVKEYERTGTINKSRHFLNL